MFQTGDAKRGCVIDWRDTTSSAELLLQFAMSYDSDVGDQLTRRIINTSTKRSVTDFRRMILAESFGEVCNNLSDVQRKQLTVKYADDIQLYILTVDDIRKNFAIPSILKVLLI